MKRFVARLDKAARQGIYEKLGASTSKTTVNGMVCSFCAQGILAHFKKHPAVSDAHVDLTRKIVLLEERKGGSITDKEITEHIRKSGFESVKVERLKQSFDDAKAC